MRVEPIVSVSSTLRPDNSSIFCSTSLADTLMLLFKKFGLIINISLLLSSKITSVSRKHGDILIKLLIYSQNYRTQMKDERAFSGKHQNDTILQKLHFRIIEVSSIKY